jgi:putative peptidoglycan lipid II flippase
MWIPRIFRPSHQHSALSATLLLMTTITLSRVIGYIREAYIAYAFGAGQQTDAYVAAFTLPDWLNYIVAGGTASITFIPRSTRFWQRSERDAQKTFSIIITVMTTVRSWHDHRRNFHAAVRRLDVSRFHTRADAACVHLTRILLPAQIFYVGGWCLRCCSRTASSFPALGPLIYNVAIIAGGVVAGHQFGIALAYGQSLAALAGPSS